MKVYICGTNWDTDLLAGRDVRLFKTLHHLKASCACWKECGVVEAEVSFGEASVIVEPDEEAGT